MLRSGVVMATDIPAMDIVDIPAMDIVAITTMDIAAITDILATTDILPMEEGITEDTVHTIRLIIEAIMETLTATTPDIMEGGTREKNAFGSSWECGR
jgi:hypothetical protein